MRIVVDRVEGDIAVLDVDGTQVDLPAAALPAGAGEGTVLSLIVDNEAGDAARAAGEARLARLRAASGGDDGGEYEL